MRKDYMDIVASKRHINWFLTDLGRKCAHNFIIGIGVTLPLTRFVPNTFLLYKYKEWVHNYENGIPVKLPQIVQDRVDKSCDALKLEDRHRKMVNPFNVAGFDLFNAGSTSFRNGIAIGIPSHFAFTSLNDVQTSNVKVDEIPLDMTTETGKKLGKALVLSEKAQEFAICREILMTHNHKVFIETCEIFIGAQIIYLLAPELNRRFNLYSKPVAVRGLMYSLVSLFGIGIYILLKDFTQQYYEFEIDKKLAELGEDYVTGGIEFYEKLLERNKALRKLMGIKGEEKYTEIGNENYLLRHPHVDLIQRKKFFELKKLNTNEY